MPGSSRPSTTWTSTTTPRYWSNHESKTRPRKGPSGRPWAVGLSGRSPPGSPRSPRHLGRCPDRPRGVDPDDVLDLLLGALGARPRQVDLVEDRDDLEAGVRGEVSVREGLGLDALARVHHEERPLARGERARDLVGEVHVAGRVDQVEDVVVPVLRLVLEAHGVLLIVMPRSRSRSIESRNCSVISRWLSAPVRSSRRSESVVLPWSMWAMIEKLRILLLLHGGHGRSPAGAANCHSSRSGGRSRRCRVAGPRRRARGRARRGARRG